MEQYQETKPTGDGVALYSDSHYKPTRWERVKDYFDDVYWSLFGFIHRPVEDTWHRFKYACERFYRGYDRTAYWGLSSYLTEIALPVLRWMRENGHGYPCKFNSMEEWNVELDKMIKAFEMMHADEYDDDWLGRYTKGRPDFNTELYESDQKIIQDGLQSFAKHYQNLWD